MGRPNCTRHLGVLDGHVEALLGATDLLGGEGHGGEVEHLLEAGGGAAVGADEAGGRAAEVEAGLLAGLVHGGQRGAGEAAGVALDGEQAEAGVGLGHHDDEVGGVAVEHEHLVAVERVAVTRLLGVRDAVEVPAAVVLGDGQRGDGLAGGDAREQLLLGGVVAASEEGVGGEGHGREVGGGEQGPAHLLEHDDQLDVGVAGAPVLLGDGEALEAQLLAHLLPDAWGRSPSVVSMSSRTAVSGVLGSRKRRTLLRSSSCSSEKAKFMGRDPVVC